MKKNTTLRKKNNKWKTSEKLAKNEKQSTHEKWNNMKKESSCDPGRDPEDFRPTLKSF